MVFTEKVGQVRDASNLKEACIAKTTEQTSKNLHYSVKSRYVVLLALGPRRIRNENALSHRDSGTIPITGRVFP